MRFVRSESAGTAVEYGLIAALIGIVVLGGMSAAFNAIAGKFNFISNVLGSSSS